MVDDPSPQGLIDEANPLCLAAMAPQLNMGSNFPVIRVVIKLSFHTLELYTREPLPKGKAQYI